MPLSWIERILETSLSQRSPSGYAQPSSSGLSPIQIETSEVPSSVPVSNPETKIYYLSRLRQMCLERGIDPSCLPSATTANGAPVPVCEQHSASSKQHSLSTSESMESGVSSLLLTSETLEHADKSDQVLKAISCSEYLG